MIDDLGNNRFKLKFDNNLTDSLSCRVIKNEEIGEIPIVQSHFINFLVERFEDEVIEKRVFKMVCHDPDSDFIDAEK